MSRPVQLLVALGTIASVVSFTQAEVRVVYVDASRTMDGDGSSWQQANRDLQTALESLNTITAEEAPTLDLRVQIAQGTYRQRAGTPWLFPAFYVPIGTCNFARSMTIAGGYGGATSSTPDARDFVDTPTILSGDVLGDDGPNGENISENCAPVFSSTDPAFPPGWQQLPLVFTVSGVIIERGFSSGQTNTPAGLRGQAWPDPQLSQRYTISDCVFRDNFSEWSEATVDFPVLTNPGLLNLTLERCSFITNSSTAGCAGIHVSSSYSTSIAGSTFVGNSGGAIVADWDISITDSTFLGNSGGAIVARGNTSIKRCRFVNNSTPSHGGALRAVDATVTDSFFFGNSASFGGAVRFESGSLSQCTLIRNTAQFGGALFFDDSAIVSLSVFEGNQASLGGSQIAGTGDSFSSALAAISGGASGCYIPFRLEPIQTLPFEIEFVDADGMDNDPLTWQDNDYHFVPRSPLIDRGFSGTPTDIDLLGLPRRREGVLGRGKRSDLGCFESQMTYCPADINADGSVTVDDLLDFLAAFEAGAGLADINSGGLTPTADGSIDVDDLIFFLAKFEQGC